jgi:hypothetical protein
MKKTNSDYFVCCFSLVIMTLISIFSSLSLARPFEFKDFLAKDIYLDSVSSAEIDATSNEVFSDFLSGNYFQQIKDLAGASSCSRYSWKNRGRAPVGYTKGIALSFARRLLLRHLL